jgi:predicted small integral membrane protein
MKAIATVILFSACWLLISCSTIVVEVNEPKLEPELIVILRAVLATHDRMFLESLLGFISVCLTTSVVTLL